MVEQLETQVENLSSLQNSQSLLDHLQKTISAQSAEIRRLNQTIKNKSQQLLTAHRNSFRSQKEFQIQLAASQQKNQQLQIRISELEKCLEAEPPPAPQLDSHNSSRLPLLDPSCSKPKRPRSLRTTSGLKVGGQPPGLGGVTLLQVADPDSVIVHEVDTCAHCHNSLLPVESKRCQKRQLFEIETDFRVPSTIAGRNEICECRSFSRKYPAVFVPSKELNFLSDSVLFEFS